MEDIRLSLAENGTGKSIVVDAAALMLSWVVARIRHARISGRAIPEEDINNQANEAQVRVTTTSGNSWAPSKTRKGHVRQFAFFQELPASLPPAHRVTATSLG